MKSARTPESRTATENAALAICRFANGTCQCGLDGYLPCGSVINAARAVIRAAREDLKVRGKARGS